MHTVLTDGRTVAIACDLLTDVRRYVAGGWAIAGRFAEYIPARDAVAALEADPVEAWWVGSWPARAGVARG